MQGRAWRGVDRLGEWVPEEVINWSTDDTDRCPFDVLVVHVQDSRLNCHESYKRRVLGGNRWSSSCWTLPPSVSALVRCFLIFHSLSCEHCGGWKKTATVSKLKQIDQLFMDLLIIGNLRLGVHKFQLNHFNVRNLNQIQSPR